MPKNKRKKAKNWNAGRSPRSDTVTHFFRGFHGGSKRDFAGEREGKEISKREKFIEAYDLSCGNVSASCKVAGIARKTFYNWIKSDAPINLEFRRRLEEIIPGQRLGDMAEFVIWQHLMNGNVEAAKFVLEKNRFMASRGYQDIKPDDKVPVEEEFRRLRRYIQKLADEDGVDYQTELRDFLKLFKEVLDEPIYEKLQSELEN